MNKISKQIAWPVFAVSLSVVGRHSGSNRRDHYLIFQQLQLKYNPVKGLYSHVAKLCLIRFPCVWDCLNIEVTLLCVSTWIGEVPKKLSQDTCIPMVIDLRHDAGKSDDLLIVWYWAAHILKWHMCSVRDVCRNHSLHWTLLC